jgi:hypothetical protein
MPDTDKLLAAIDSYAENTHGDSGELSRQRSLALDVYAGKNIEPAPEGRSQVTDWSVFETVNWIMPSLMRIYGGINGDKIVEFDPTGPEDEDAAEQESEYLNYLVTQKNDWEITARTWLQDALITKNAYCMAYMDERLVPEIERYEGQTEEQVALLLDDDVEVVGQRQYDDPDDDGIVINPTTGMPVQDEMESELALAAYLEQGMEPVMQYRQLFDLEVRRVKPVESLCFKVLPPERVRVGNDTPSFQIDDDTNYLEHWERVTISDLRKQGFDVSDDIAEGDSYTVDWEEDQSRDEIYELDREYDSPDPSMRKVSVRTIWIRYDYDEDGIAELIKVIRVGDEILYMDHESRIPVACIVPFMNTHRHIGMSVADLVFDIQRIKTALLRGGLDGMNLALNPRHAISPEVNVNDMLISRPGAIIRVDGNPGEGHIMPIQTENVFPYAQQGLDHMDRVIESRVGVNRMFQGIDESALNDHNRVGQLSTMAAQRVEDIARIFSAGFKRLFSISHELIIKSGRVDKTIKLRGQWVDIDPSQWRTGRDMRVVAPFAAGNKDALLQRLMAIVSLQEKAFAAGLPIVDADDAYNLALEISKAADLPGTKFFTDPATIPPQEPEPDYTGIALEIENKKADTAQYKAQADTEIDKYEADLDAEVKRWTTEVQTEMERYKTDLQAQLQLLFKQLELNKEIDLVAAKERFSAAPFEIPGFGRATVDEVDKHMAEKDSAIDVLESDVRALSEDNRMLREYIEAPKEVVRENGRVVGVKQGDEFRRVTRDAGGKIISVEPAKAPMTPRETNKLSRRQKAKAKRR